MINIDGIVELLSLECEVTSNNIIRYRNSAGLLHRIHGPAVIYPSGVREWHQDGQRHRDTGPAVERPTGLNEIWKYGERIW